MIFVTNDAILTLFQDDTFLCTAGGKHVTRQIRQIFQ